MRLVVLGCCGGYPAPAQACSGYLVQAAGEQLWVDAGSGTFSRLLQHCSLGDLASIWITHLHPDHWTDLPLALHALALRMSERDAPLPVYGPPGWVSAIGWSVESLLMEADPVFQPLELADGLVVDSGEVRVEAAAVKHEIETFALRFGATGMVLAYSADSAPCEGLLRVARGADIFLCAAGTMASSSAIHLNPAQAGELATSAAAKTLIVTHLRPPADRQKVARLAGGTYLGPIEVATEGAVYTIDRP